MDQFETMLSRACRRWCSRAWDQEGEGDRKRFTQRAKRARLAWARAVAASQKGRSTLMEGWMRPAPMALVDEFMCMDSDTALEPGIAEGCGLPAGDLAALRLLGARMQGELGAGAAWTSPGHEAFDDFFERGRGSLHDVHLMAWSRQGSTIRMEFDGSFLEEGERELLMVFEGAGAKALWLGKAAGLPREGSWRRGPTWRGPGRGSGWFARELSKGVADAEKLFFRQLPYIQTSQFSAAGSERPELRLLFGRHRSFELAVWGSSVEIVIGAEAIAARDEREGLLRELPAPVASARFRASI